MNRINKMRVSKNNVNRLISILSVLTLSVTLILLLSFPMSHNTLAQSQSQLQTQGEEQHSPNIQASNIYQTHTMVLGKISKTL
jgi:predicted PurR-regulated permease PerM